MTNNPTEGNPVDEVVSVFSESQSIGTEFYARQLLKMWQAKGDHGMCNHLLALVMGVTNYNQAINQLEKDHED